MQPVWNDEFQQLKTHSCPWTTHRTHKKRRKNCGLKLTIGCKKRVLFGTNVHTVTVLRHRGKQNNGSTYQWARCYQYRQYKPVLGMSNTIGDEAKKRTAGKRISSRKEAFRVILPDGELLLRNDLWIELKVGKWNSCCGNKCLLCLHAGILQFKCRSKLEKSQICSDITTLKIKFEDLWNGEENVKVSIGKGLGGSI